MRSIKPDFIFVGPNYQVSLLLRPWDMIYSLSIAAIMMIYFHSWSSLCMRFNLG